MIKTLFFKLYEFKNPLFLKGVSKLIGIQLLNDISVIQNSTKEKILLNLLEIDDDDIGSSKFIEPLTLRPFKLSEFLILRPLELIIIRPFKPLKPENKLIEKFIKPIDSSNLNKI